MISRTRLSRFSASNIESWVEPGDEANTENTGIQRTYGYRERRDTENTGIQRLQRHRVCRDTVIQKHRDTEIQRTQGYRECR